MSRSRDNSEEMVLVKGHKLDQIRGHTESDGGKSSGDDR